MKKKSLLILFTTLLLPLTACEAFNFLPNGGNILPTSSAQKDLDNTFINTGDNEKYFVTLNKSNLILIPGQTFQFYLGVAKDFEEPAYDSHWEKEEWGSENSEVAKIDATGKLTAVGAGTTRIFGKLFPTVGAYCNIQVLNRELESISVKNQRKTYIIGDDFSPVFTCVAHYKGGIEEVVTGATADYSNVNMEAEGTYTVNVSYTLNEVTKTTSYEIKVTNNQTYEAKNLDYTANDLYRSKTYGWYTPREGDVKGLVIPIYFTDTNSYLEEDSTTKEKVLTDLQKAFYGPEGPDGWNSVASYYHKVSDGKLNLNGTVSNWYEPGYSSAYVNTSARINELVADAVNWYFKTTKEDMNDYDSDHNGVFDSLNIIYGCTDEAHGISLYWGKISSQSTPIVEGKGDDPDIKFHMWASFHELYVDNFHSEVDSHVYCHETGHTFGLEDYYDYGENEYRPVAGATMMFHNTHQQDPYSTLSLGWSKVYVPETSCVIELEDYQSSHTSILLSTHPESADSPFDEYILVELYAPNGVNQYDSTYKWKGFYTNGPQEAGIRLWHVDARIAEENGEGYVLADSVLTTNPSTLAFSNSWGSSHASVMGEAYYDNCLLFEIRNDKEITYKPTTDDKACMVSDATLFHSGDVFTLGDYSNQFVKGTTLNNGEAFNWKITIEAIETTEGGYISTINLELL